LLWLFCQSPQQLSEKQPDEFKRQLFDMFAVNISSGIADVETHTLQHKCTRPNDK